MYQEPPSTHHRPGKPSNHLPTFSLALLPILGALLMAPAMTSAQRAGDLMVNPTRVVFEGRDRTADLVLVGRGTAPATYRIAFIEMSMTEAGDLVEVPQTEMVTRPSSDLVRFSPRQVTLEPGVAQAVRLFLRAPADLPPGEYRSHLYLRALPETSPNDLAPKDIAGDQVAIQLTPVYGVAVPVIVRRGELAANARLEQLHLVQASEPAAGHGPTGIELNVIREGHRSIYADITVTHLRTDGTEPVVVGRARGLAVYLPIEQRRVVVPIEPPPEHQILGGRLLVELSEPADTPRRVTATASLDLP